MRARVLSNFFTPDRQCTMKYARVLSVDGEAALGLKEVQPAGVDDEPQRISLARGRLRVDTCDEGRVGISPEREVDEHLRSERFSQAADRHDRALERSADDERCVLDVLGTDAEDDVAALVRAKRWVLG